MANALLFTLTGIAPAAPASGETRGVPFGAADTFERLNDAKRLLLGHEPPSPSPHCSRQGTRLASRHHRGHSCALLLGGSVRCWGSQSFGPVLGQGTPALQDTRIGDNEPPTDIGAVALGGPAEEIAVGNVHSGALPDYGDDEPASAGPLVTADDLGGSSATAPYG